MRARHLGDRQAAAAAARKRQFFLLLKWTISQSQRAQIELSFFNQGKCQQSQRHVGLACRKQSDQYSDPCLGEKPEVLLQDDSVSPIKWCF